MFRIRKILCPVDFFPASRRAFHCALGLAAKYKANLHVTHVVPPVITEAYGAPVGAAELVADLEREALGQLHKLKAEALKTKVSLKTEVKIGDIDWQLREALETQRPDLLVMGTHGRHGLDRLLLGSVTERMIRHCPAPLLLVGHRGSGPVASFGFQRILVTTDFSKGTEDALSSALSIAKEHGARLTLLHVVDDAIADGSGNYRESLLSGVEEKLKTLVSKAGVSHLQIDAQVATGLPFRVIPGILKRGKYDLLVMNIHGKTLVERVLIGSTAERVVRAVSNSCPILLIPPAGSRHGRTKKG